jgi:hypothetical protein
MDRYNVRLSKYRNSGGSDPGERAEAEAAIEYTQPGDMVTVVRALDRNHIINTIANDNRAVQDLRALGLPRADYTKMTVEQIKHIINTYLQVRERTIEVLADYGEEPTR